MSNPAHSLFVVTLYRYAAAHCDPRRADRPGRSLMMRFEPNNRTEVELPAGSNAAQALELVLADRVLSACAGRALVAAAGELAALEIPASRLPRLERFAVEAMVMPDRPTDGRSWEASHYVATVDVDSTLIRVESGAGETDAAWTAALDRLRRGVS